jgi:glycosyltransferase involved in cell wall biosynthesis
MERQPDSAAACALRALNDLPEEFVLFVGTLEPRKNVALLLDAWSLLEDRHGLRPTLVIVGGKGWFYEALEARVQALGLSSRVRFAGYVLDADLPVWYSAATLFVYPSLYEGFGLPPLEALACGTPAIVSDRSSLPEVVGDAGLALPPDDAQAWADAIALLLGSPDKRKAMSEAGLRQAARFSWSQTAGQTAEVYRQVLEND